MPIFCGGYVTSVSIANQEIFGLILWVFIKKGEGALTIFCSLLGENWLGKPIGGEC